MAAEREQKLRNYNHIQKADDYVTANQKHSPNSPKKQSTSGQHLPKNSVPVVEEERPIENPKKLRRKVCVITYI